MNIDSFDFLQTILSMETMVIPFVPHLYPVLLKALQDEDGEVRGNGTYAIGVLAAYGGEAIVAYPLRYRL